MLPFYHPWRPTSSLLLLSPLCRRTSARKTQLPEKSPEKPCVPPNPRDSITPSTPTFLSSPSVCPSFMSSQEALPSCLPKRPFLHVFPRGLQSTQLVWCPLTHGPPQTPHYQTQNLMISGLRVNWKAQPSQNHQRTPKSRVSGCPICPVGKGNAVKCKE